MPYITHGRLLTFANNGFHFSNQFLNSTIITAASVSTITCWPFATYMFLYRLHLVKNRTPPKSLPFFLYASVPICSFFLYSFSVVKGMSLFETSNSRTIENRVLILKHVGFQLSKTEIFEVLSGLSNSRLSWIVGQ
ncbi:hypothetical protein M3Y98_01195200 [Aphelenchoides besseyi]|nr:hypothetical protein M3Y98_01195200 [Aphelenchoides besseyi]